MHFNHEIRPLIVCALSDLPCMIYISPKQLRYLLACQYHSVTTSQRRFNARPTPSMHAAELETKQHREQHDAYACFCFATLQ